MINNTILMFFVSFGTFSLCIGLYIIFIKIYESKRIYNSDILSDESSDSNFSIENNSVSNILLNEQNIINMSDIVHSQNIGIIEYNSIRFDLKDECCICLENYSSDNKIGILECCHVYHYDCILSWFEKNKNQVCPNCMNTVEDRRRLSKDMLCDTETS